MDTICIDQQNRIERGQQVQLMKAIYEFAEQVLVWLGSSSDDSDLAIDLIDEITDADEVDQALEDDPDVRIKRTVIPIRASLSDSNNTGKWQALASLIHWLWWERLGSARK